jgi:DNA polymerase-3 subunit delta'
MLKGDDTYPVEQSLVFNLAMRPYYGGRKVAIVDDADYLNLAGANGLLKTLEEPPPGSILILISTSADRQLPTIRSRAQIIRFQPLAESIVANLLLKNQIVGDPAVAQRLAAFSGGSLARAAELAGDPEMFAFRNTLLKQLSQAPVRSVALAQTITKFVDEAGKEAPARRARLRSVIGFTVDFFRQAIRELAGLEGEGDAELRSAARRAARHGGWDIETAGEAAQRSLEALAHIDRNANLHTVVEAWLDDLLALGGPTAATTAK